MKHRGRQRKVGISLILAAIVLPSATYAAARAWLRYLASVEPIPNQGAMVVAFLAVCASMIVALALLAPGIIMLVRARKTKA
jgi:hypothetical protein